MKLPEIKLEYNIPDNIRTGEVRKGLPIMRLQVDFPIWINGRLIVIPGGPEDVGYEHDSGSIPRFGRWLVTPNDPLAAAGYIAHDLNCDAELYTRYSGDKILLACHIERGVPRWKRNLIFGSVVPFGGSCLTIRKMNKKARDAQTERVLKTRRLLGIEDMTTRPLWGKL